jgi:hypothetical protein
VLAALLGSLTVSSCAVNGLSFETDDRISMSTPEENETVVLPFEVTWNVDDYDGRFIVFFDRSPMRPDQGLRALVPDDDPCRREPGCPDEAWLTEHRIFIVEGSSLSVEHLPDLRDSGRGEDRHDVTVVLLDADDERQGESAWTREFIVERSR